jgi:hypothetical protein
MVGMATLSSGSRAAAAKKEMPEPILAESVTDIDAGEAGEIELSANAFGLGLARGARFEEASAEVEWRATDRLGLRLEPTYVYQRGARRGAVHAFDLGAAASWSLMHDWKRDFHLQIELTGHVGSEGVDSQERYVQPGDPALPLALDLRAAIRRGYLTLRTAFGAEAFGPAGDRVGVRASAAALIGFGREALLGFAGLELDADSARTHPFVVAPDIVADIGPLGLPLKLGVALPWVVGAGQDEPRLGVYLRLMFQTDLDESEHDREARPRSDRPGGSTERRIPR